MGTSVTNEAYAMGRIPPELARRAAALRRDATGAEQLLWRLLRKRQIAGAKFRRQHSIPPYIVDFCCLKARLCVEVDGGQHAEPESEARDRARDVHLRQRGYRVLRFWNCDVLTDTDAVLQSIWDALQEPEGQDGPTP